MRGFGKHPLLQRPIPIHAVLSRAVLGKLREVETDVRRRGEISQAAEEIKSDCQEQDSKFTNPSVTAKKTLMLKIKEELAETEEKII